MGWPLGVLGVLYGLVSALRGFPWSPLEMPGRSSGHRSVFGGRIGPLGAAFCGLGHRFVFF